MSSLRGVKKTVAGAALLAALAPLGARAGELRLEGFAAGSGAWADGAGSWLEGGFGRLVQGEPRETEARAELQALLEWRPAENWRLRAHGFGRLEPDDPGGDRAGLVEAFLEQQTELGLTSSLRFRAGLLFPGTSLENVGPAWSSPYTLTLSALNTWTAEEVRFGGLEARLRRTDGVTDLQLVATAFVANDTTGALLAWRGWSMGSRLTGAFEVVPLPPLASLRAGGGFQDQRDDGTRPIDELDDRVGWQARVRWSRVGRIALQGSFFDNRGDRKLHDGQYAWDTRFWTAGAELDFGGGVLLLAEGLIGDTAMGDPQATHVDTRLRAGYVMFTWGGERARASVRYDRFQNSDNDGSAEPNDDEGEAWTLAVFWLPRTDLRLGLEWVDLSADRGAPAASGFALDTDGRRLLFEARFSF